MTTHEQDALCERLLDILKREAPQPVFCSEHASLKKRTWWGSVKFLGVIAALLSTCAGSIWWVSKTGAEAMTTAASAVTDMKSSFVDQRIFDTGQAAQDTKIDGVIRDSSARIDRLQTTVDRNTLVVYENSGLLKAIAGKMGVQKDGS